MKPEKLIKKQIIEQASKNPEKFYPVKALEKFGLKRYTCEKSGTKFWSSIPRKVCGDTEYVGGYLFIGKSPAKKKMTFPQVYLEFSKMLQKKGYTPIKRFPVVARWRDDLDFNIASIVGFQPYVVKGEVAPPANPLTIPQICLRFGDIDNIGYTGRHHTGFTMIGQHTFQSPENYKPEQYFTDLFEWFLNGLQIPLDKLVVHEDAWAGGGNCGASLEIFCDGLELGNQVYMTYDMSGATDISELKELKIKVLDMGMGQERCCWISQATHTSYDACMPKAIAYIKEKTKAKYDLSIYQKFLPYSGLLNIDEVEDINKAWDNVAKTLKIPVDELRATVEPLAGIYSIADHTRTLLYALSDGALPSNVKGGYNLRLILRRALDFCTKFDWKIDLFEVMKIHAEELKELYPELSEDLVGISKIIAIETVKYYEHRQKIESFVKQLAQKGKIPTNDEYIEYYISQGITPEDIAKGFSQLGKTLAIPANFYTLVTENFATKTASVQKEEKNKLSEFITGLPSTELLFYSNTKQLKAEVKILKEFECDKKHYIVLDKTLFYPTMGGQANDTGKIAGKTVIAVLKIGNVIVHQVQ